MEDNQQHTDKLCGLCMPGMHNITLNSDNIIRNRWDPSIFGPWRRHLVLSRTWPYTTWLSKHWQWVLPQFQLFCLYFHKYSNKQAHLWNTKPSVDLTSMALVEFLPVENFAGQCLALAVIHQHSRTLADVFWSCALWTLTPESHSHSGSNHNTIYPQFSP